VFSTAPVYASPKKRVNATEQRHVIAYQHVEETMHDEHDSLVDYESTIHELIEQVPDESQEDDD
jgi:hypothetical protein